MTHVGLLVENSISKREEPAPRRLQPQNHLSGNNLRPMNPCGRYGDKVCFLGAGWCVVQANSVRCSLDLPGRAVQPHLAKTYRYRPDKDCGLAPDKLCHIGTSPQHISNARNGHAQIQFQKLVHVQIKI
jgi:hypothetical protein